MDSFTISEDVHRHLSRSLPKRPREIELPSLLTFASLLGLRGHGLDEDQGSGKEAGFPCFKEPTWITTRFNCIFCTHEQSCSSGSTQRDGKITTSIHLIDKSIHFLDKHFNEESVQRHLTSVFPSFDVFCEPHSQPISRTLVALPLSTPRSLQRRTPAQHLYFSEILNRTLTLFEATLFHFIEDLVFQTRLREEVSHLHLNEIIDSGCLSLDGWREGLSLESSYNEQCSAMVEKILSVFKNSEKYEIYKPILNQFFREYGRKYEEGSLRYSHEFGLEDASTDPLELVEFLFASISHAAGALPEDQLTEMKLFDGRVDVVLLNNTNESLPDIHPIFRVIRQYSLEDMPTPVLLMKDSSYRSIKREFYLNTFSSVPEDHRGSQPLTVLAYEEGEYQCALTVIAAVANKNSFGFSIKDYSNVLQQGLSRPHFAVLPASEIFSVGVLQKYLLRLITNLADEGLEQLKMRLRDVFQELVPLWSDFLADRISFNIDRYEEVLNHFLGSSEFTFTDEGQILKALSDFCKQIPVEGHCLFEYEEIITDENHTMQTLTWQVPRKTSESVVPLHLHRVDNSNSSGADNELGRSPKFIYGEAYDLLFNSTTQNNTNEEMVHFRESLGKLKQELNSNTDYSKTDVRRSLVGAIVLSPNLIKCLNQNKGPILAKSLLDILRDACHHATVVIGTRGEMAEFQAIGVASHLIQNMIGSDFFYFRVPPSYDIGGNLFHGTNSIRD